jgi:hypothetical protein
MRLTNYFTPNTEFCSICLTHEKWWTGGASWSPDRCPKHNENDGDCVHWKNMSVLKKKKAANLFSDMWKEEYGHAYAFTPPYEGEPDTRARHEKPEFLSNTELKKIKAINDLLKYF